MTVLEFLSRFCEWRGKRLIFAAKWWTAAMEFCDGEITFEQFRKQTKRKRGK